MKGKHLAVLAIMKARPGMEERLLEELTKLVEPTRKEDGCIQYDLHVSLTDPAEFLFVEAWSNQAALSKHAESDHVQAFRAVRDQYLTGPTQLTLWDPLG